MLNLRHGVTICDICQGGDFRLWRLGLLQCKSCGLILSPAIWQPQANEELEVEWFGDENQTRQSVWVTWFEARNNRRTLGRLAGGKPVARRLLEIGVGSGSFLHAARERGYEVMGCDLSGPICKRVRNTYGIEMHCGPLTTLSRTALFDFIVMNHVLEHVQHPVEFLRDVSRLLMPGGVVHIAVPNVACWEARLPGWTSFEPYHLIYFAPATLLSTVNRSGFEIVQIRTHESFSGWFLAVLRTALGVNRGSGAVERPVTSAGGSAAGPRSSFVENAYRAVMIIAGSVLWPIRFLQGKSGRGDEIICIARKPELASHREGSL